MKVGLREDSQSDAFKRLKGHYSVRIGTVCNSKRSIDGAIQISTNKIQGVNRAFRGFHRVNIEGKLG